MSAFLADVLVAIHFAIVSFCVLGEVAILAGAAFRWEWVRNIPFRIAHLCLVLYVAGEAILGIPCPLTEWEYRLRVMAGQHQDQDLSFVARLIRSIIFYDFPAWFFTALYVGFGVLVLLSFILVRPRRKRRAG
jgi:hypothetical protein